MVAEHRASAALHFVPLDGGFQTNPRRRHQIASRSWRPTCCRSGRRSNAFAERTERALAGLVSDSAGVAKLDPQERNQQRTAAEITEVPIPQRQEHVSCPGSCNICSGEQCRPGFGNGSNLMFPYSFASASCDRGRTTMRFTDSSACEETDPVLVVGDPQLTSVTDEKFELWKAGWSSFVPIPKNMQNVQISESMADGHEVPARADEILRVIKENHAEKYLEFLLKLPRKSRPQEVLRTVWRVLKLWEP